MENSYITLFDETTGEILQWICGGPADLELNIQAAVNPHIRGMWDSSQYYVVDGKAVERPVMELTIEGTILRGIPANSTITVDGVTYSVTEPTDVELEFPQPGTYTLHISCWPFKDKEVEYENNPQ